MNKEPCRFETFKINARTKVKNHSLIHKRGYAFSEFNCDEFELAIDSLKKKVMLCGAGLDEFAPHEKLLIQLLEDFGF